MADSSSIVYQNFQRFVDRLNAVKDRGSVGLRAYLNDQVYTQIQNAQMQRWVSEGASEGKGWDKLNPAYAESKLKRFRDYPGQGSKMLIATSTLVSSVIGPMKESSVIELQETQFHRKLVDENSIFVGTTLPYGLFVNEIRNFTRLSVETKRIIFDGIKAFIVRNRK